MSTKTRTCSFIFLRNQSCHNTAAVNSPTQFGMLTANNDLYRHLRDPLPELNAVSHCAATFNKDTLTIIFLQQKRKNILVVI